MEGLERVERLDGFKGLGAGKRQAWTPIRSHWCGLGMPVAKKDKFHTCGVPRRRPCLGQGRGRRIIVILLLLYYYYYIIINYISWCSFLLPMLGPAFLSFFLALVTPSHFRGIVFPDFETQVDWVIRPAWIRGWDGCCIVCIFWPHGIIVLLESHPLKPVKPLNCMTLYIYIWIVLYTDTRYIYCIVYTLIKS